MYDNKYGKIVKNYNDKLVIVYQFSNKFDLYNIIENKSNKDLKENMYVRFESIDDNAIVTYVSDYKYNKEKLIKINCEVCGSEFLGNEPEYCCNGKDCGCRGMSIDPIVCSPHCYHSLPFLKSNYLTWLEVSIEPLSSYIPTSIDKDLEINVIIRYTTSIIGIKDHEMEIVTHAYYTFNKGFYDDKNITYENVTHYMHFPKSPM